MEGASRVTARCADYPYWNGQFTELSAPAVSR
jgi:hypothetical protein